jgi:hypothetical protein
MLQKKTVSRMISTKTSVGNRIHSSISLMAAESRPCPSHVKAGLFMLVSVFGCSEPNTLFLVSYRLRLQLLDLLPSPTQLICQLYHHYTALWFLVPLFKLQPSRLRYAIL